MIPNGKTVEDNFMRYLAGLVSPAQLSEFYRCYSEIEAFCLKIKVLKNPLFETTDFETIKKVQRTIEQNKIFRITRKRQINKIVDAGRYYYNYIKDGLYVRITARKNIEGCSTIDREKSNQEPPDDEASKAESPITAHTKTEQDERTLQEKTSESTPDNAEGASGTKDLHSQSQTFEIDLRADFDLAGTKPERFSYFDENEVRCDSWAAL